MSDSTNSKKISEDKRVIQMELKELTNMIESHSNRITQMENYKHVLEDKL